MASLHIVDPATADRVLRLAERLGTSEAEAIRRSVDALEQTLDERPDFDETPSASRLRDRMARFRREHPLAPATGLKADKAFFDALWGEE